MDYEIMNKMSISFNPDILASIKGEASFYQIGNSLYLSNLFTPPINDRKNAILCASIRFKDSINKIGF